MKEVKRYIEHDGLKDATHLEVSVYYSKGGTSYFGGNTTPRGYYLAVKPVTKGHSMIRFTLFSGRSRFLLETKRFSAKQFARAADMAKDYEEELIAAVVAENKVA